MAEGGYTMTIQVAQMTVGDVSRTSLSQGSWELAAMREWQSATPEWQGDVRAIVRAALMRLLSSPSWLPGAVRCSGGRLDLRIVIELDAETERHRAEDISMTFAEIRELRAAARRRLLALADELVEEDEVPGG